MRSSPLSTMKTRSGIQRPQVWLRTMLALAVLSAAWTSLAGPVQDPTRPPPGLQTAPAAAPTNPLAYPPGLPPAAAPASAPAAVVQAAPVVQAVQLPLRGPAMAMVDGRLVKLGDTVGKRVVSAIDHQGVVLREPGTGRVTEERLWLLSAQGKQPPGTITVTRKTTFSPATTDGESASADNPPVLTLPLPQADRAKSVTTPANPVPQVPVARNPS